MRALLFLCLLTAACSELTVTPSALLGDSADPLRGQPGALMHPPTFVGPGVNGETAWADARGTFGFTWDGLVALSTKHIYLGDRGAYGEFSDGLFAHVYRPDLVTLGAGGPDFTRAMSDMVPVEMALFADQYDTSITRATRRCFGQACDPFRFNPASGMCMTHGVALFPAPARYVAQRFPGVDLRENPFPSDARGFPIADGQSATAFRTYVFETVIGDMGRAECVGGAQTASDVLGRRYGYVVVSLRTVPGLHRPVPDAVVLAGFITPFEALTFTAGEAFSTDDVDAKQIGAELVSGIEPSVTRDGRLLLFHGGEGSTGGLNHIKFSYRRGDRYWTEPEELTRLNLLTAGVKAGGIAFDERYPLARHPLRTPLNEALADDAPVYGAYPWVDPDGALVTFSAMNGLTWGGVTGLVVPYGADARRTKQVAVGAATGWRIKVLDTPGNSFLVEHPRVVAGSAGRYDGAWDVRLHSAPTRDVLPYRPERGLLGLFSSLHRSLSYDEISFRDYEDGHYLLATSLTEPFSMPGAADWLPVLDRAQDMSPGGRTVLLEGGATFPILAQTTMPRVDRPEGIIGQAVACRANGRVRVPGDQALAQWKQLTVELWIRPMGAAVPVVLASGAGFRLELGANRFVVAQMGTATLVTANAVPDRVWSHVGLTLSADRAQLFIDGQAMASTALGTDAADVPRSNGELRFCEVGAAAAGVIAYLDDVYVSDVVRTPTELMTSALRYWPVEHGSPAGALPRGLQADEHTVPLKNPVTAAKVELGRHLFFDRHLSANEKVSCAGCHDPTQGFSDGVPRSFGVSEVRRRSPSIVNLALRSHGDGFFWDGRAATLEQQALAPFTAPAEHGLKGLDELMTRIADRDVYADLFAQAFPLEPAASPGRVADALASFVRSLTAADAAADRFEAGDTKALTDAQIRGRELFFGKARCAACHSGSTYSDGRAHRTGTHVVDPRDFGRGEVTLRLSDVNRFITPSLRDLRRRSFLLHDGLLGTAQLDLLLQNYAAGGHVRTPAPDGELLTLDLSALERSQLADFVLDGLKSGAYPAPVDPFGGK